MARYTGPKHKIARKEGINIYYCIANPKIIQVCTLMKEVLLEQLEEKGKMASRLQRMQ